MLHACIERFDVMCVRGNILGWEGEVNEALGVGASGQSLMTEFSRIYCVHKPAYYKVFGCSGHPPRKTRIFSRFRLMAWN
jgi:hypothetical protein